MFDNISITGDFDSIAYTYLDELENGIYEEIYIIPKTTYHIIS
jgi:hypothetical protein